MIDFGYWRAMLRNDVDAVFKLLLGSILLLIPGLNLAVLGYGMRCLANSLWKKQRLPAWHNCKELVIEGGIAFGILLAYLALPLVIGFVLRPLLGAGKLLGWILAGFSMLFVPLGWANWQVYHEWQAAFFLKEIWERLYCHCAVYLLFTAGMVGVIALGVILLFMLPLLGIFGGILIFSYSVFFFFEIGRMFCQT